MTDSQLDGSTTIKNFCKIVTFVTILGEKKRKALRRALTNDKLITSFYNRFSLNNLVFSKTKDKIQNLEKSNLIYCLKCSCNANYTGQTR